MKKNKFMKIIKSQISKRYGVEIKNDSIMMETNWKLSSEEEALKEKFLLPEVMSMSEAASVPLYGRLSLGPVYIEHIGELSKTGANVRKELQVSMEGRSALLTLWGERAEQSSIILGGTYNIMAVKAANEFRGQRVYDSTPSTTFEMAEEKEETDENFEGQIESVSFESNLIEVDGELIIMDTQRNDIFPENSFEEGKVVQGTKRKGEIITISIAKKNKIE